MSDDENIDDLPPFQWIFHFECFHFLKRVYVKEFCAYCIQTGESFTLHINTPASVLLDLDPMHVSTFALQTARHGFTLTDGDISTDDFHKTVVSRVDRYCSIYTCSKIVQKYFSDPSKYTYPLIHNIKMPPNLPIKLPDTVCPKNHSATHCAQRKVHELARF